MLESRQSEKYLNSLIKPLNALITISDPAGDKTAGTIAPGGFLSTPLIYVPCMT